MAELKTLLGALPNGLRSPLIKEYKNLTQNYMEHRWEPAELSAGKICEIVFTIIKGHVDGAYPSTPSKPRNMVNACRQLETEASLPRSFQILIPRMLPALYEIRNNRGVGHVGSEVDANNVDATLMLSMVNWIMAELVRVFHTGSLEEAQAAINTLAERKTPLVWDNKTFKKVLTPGMKLKDQILLLASATDEEIKLVELMEWTESTNKVYYKKMLKSLHKDKLIHYNEKDENITLLPSGSNKVSDIVTAHTQT
jgi:hypothetical protein